MVIDVHETRRLSAALFGNEKVVEVVLALDARRSPSTAQDVARSTGISHSMVRDVLLRLSAAGLTAQLPKVGSTRSPQYYEPSRSEAWTLLVRLVQIVRTQADRLDTPEETRRG